MNSGLFSDKRKPCEIRAWMDLKKWAWHGDEPTAIELNGQRIRVERGEYCTTCGILAKRWGWTERQVYLFIERLVKCRLLKKRGGNQYTKLRLCRPSDFDMVDVSADEPEDCATDVIAPDTAVVIGAAEAQQRFGVTANSHSHEGCDVSSNNSKLLSKHSTNTLLSPYGVSSTEYLQEEEETVLREEGKLRNAGQAVCEQSATRTSGFSAPSYTPRYKFVPPTLEEVKAYCIKANLMNTIPEKFYYKNQQRGWTLSAYGFDWKAAMRAWDANGYDMKNRRYNDSAKDNAKIKKYDSEIERHYYQNDNRHGDRGQKRSFIDDLYAQAGLQDDDLE